MWINKCVAQGKVTREQKKSKEQDTQQEYNYTIYIAFVAN